jgi:hypothetical protein
MQDEDQDEEDNDEDVEDDWKRNNRWMPVHWAG